MELIDRRALPWEQQELDQYGNWTLKAEYIDSAPTISAVPVVRCRECRWYNAGANDSESWSDCTFRYGKHFNVSPDDFCSYGQRKIETVLPKSDTKDESLEANHDKHPSDPV